MKEEIEDPTPKFHWNSLDRVRELRSAALITAEALYRCAAALAYDSTPRESVADQITRHADRLLTAAKGPNATVDANKSPGICARCGLPRITIRSSCAVPSPTDRCVPVAYPVVGGLVCWRQIPDPTV